MKRLIQFSVKLQILNVGCYKVDLIKKSISYHPKFNIRT